MPQIIKHKRGTLESLSAATGSALKGELLIAVSSSNITTTNGTSLVFAAVADGRVQAVNRFLLGSSAPSTFANSTYNGLVNGVPYYSSGNNTLYLLGQDTNTIPDLTGNISTFSGSVSTTLISLQNQISTLSGSNIAANLDTLNAFATSSGNRLNSIEAATSSYETKGRNIVSSSSDTTNIDITITNGVISAELRGGVVSGSSQVISLLPAGTISGSSQVNGTQITNNTITIAGTSTALGSSITLATITGNSGIISGSGQLTGYETVGRGIVSGAAQIVPLLPTGTVSGSSQITYSNISGIPGGIVSGAAQVVSLLPAGTISGSSQVLGGTGILSSSNTTFASYTQSIATQLSGLSGLTGSYATTGSNTFRGTQIISGTLYVTQDLIIQGSSSIQNISSSVVNIGSNLFTVNVNQPAIRFGGFAVIDSGSGGGSGSLLYDSLQDEFIFVHRGNGTNVTSSHFVLGPETIDSLGNEIYLTNNRIPKGTGKEHLNDSQISDNGSTVSIPGMLSVTAGITGSLNGNADTATKLLTARTINGTSFDGSANITIPNLVSGSSQITYNQLSGIPLNIISGAADSTTVDFTITGGSITANLIGGVVSGSSQVTYSGLSGIPGGIVSGSSQITPLLPAGTISGSSQVNFTQISNLSANIISASSDSSTIDFTISGGSITAVAIGGIVSGSSQVSYTGLSNIPSGIVSGSSQITYSGLSGIPGGIVSGAAQIVPLLPAGTVSGSSQINGTQISNNTITIAGTSTALGGTITLTTITGGSNIVSGSSQITYSNISGIPANIVSSSAQVVAFLPSGVVSSSAQIGSGILSSSNTTFAAYTSSVNNRLSVLEGTGTIQGVGTGNSPTFNNLTLSGDLVVQGSTVTLNTTELVVEDKLISLASGSTTAAAANGAGIEIKGANATFTYDSTPDAWTLNKPLSGSAVTASINVPGFGSSKRVAFRGTTGNIDFVTAPTTDGDLVQWNGTDFVMSNTIDGGTF